MVENILPTSGAGLEHLKKKNSQATNTTEISTAEEAKNLLTSASLSLKNMQKSQRPS